MKNIRKKALAVMLSASLLGSGLVSSMTFAAVLAAPAYNNALVNLMIVARNAAKTAKQRGISGNAAAKFIADAVNPGAVGQLLEGAQYASAVATTVFCAANVERVPQVSQQMSATEAAVVTRVERGTNISIFECSNLIAATNPGVAGVAGGGAIMPVGGLSTTAIYAVIGLGLVLGLSSGGGGGGGGGGDDTPVSR